MIIHIRRECGYCHAYFEEFVTELNNRITYSIPRLGYGPCPYCIQIMWFIVIEVKEQEAGSNG